MAKLLWITICLSAIFGIATGRPDWHRDEVFKIKRIRMFSSEEQQESIAMVKQKKCGYAVS